MTPDGWLHDRRPVRRVAANEHAPSGTDAWPASIPAVAQLLREVGAWGLRDTAWDDLELVAHWRRYLDEPMRYLRHVIDGD
jgi:hypothetical protein